MSTNRREHRHADRRDVRRRAADEREHEVDVVDHQVEHDRDVGAARIERREPVALDEARRVDVRQRRADRAVEPLDVSRLQRSRRAPLRSRAARRPPRASSRSASRSARACPRSSAALRDGVVRRRRHDDRHRVDLVEQRVERRERAYAELASRPARRARRRASKKPAKLDARHVAQNAHVMEAEPAGADDADLAPACSDHDSALALLEERRNSCTSGNGSQLRRGALHRLRDVQLRPEEQPVRALQLADAPLPEIRCAAARRCSARTA